LFIASTEHYNVATGETIALVEVSEPRCGAFGDKVGAHSNRIFTQCATNYLDNLAIAKINAGTKHATN
jgi:hypothetical protein